METADEKQIQTTNGNNRSESQIYPTAEAPVALNVPSQIYPTAEAPVSLNVPSQIYPTAEAPVALNVPSQIYPTAEAPVSLKVPSKIPRWPIPDIFATILSKVGIARSKVI